MEAQDLEDTLASELGRATVAPRFWVRAYTGDHPEARQCYVEPLLWAIKDAAASREIVEPVIVGHRMEDGELRIYVGEGNKWPTM